MAFSLSFFKKPSMSVSITGSSGSKVLLIDERVSNRDDSFGSSTPRVDSNNDLKIYFSLN